MKIAAFLVVSGAFVSVAAPTSAHLSLLSPPSRYGASVLKVGPCGRANGERSANVTILEPGATIDVAWEEYVDHPGHFRIAFDDDGDDDFTDPPCTEGCDGRSPVIATYSDDTVLLDGIPDTRGGESQVRVALPDIECEQCTLQVIQVMYDKPPYTTPGNDIYYQCADLILRRNATPTVSPGLPTPTASPSPSVSVCVGDCDGAGDVTVDEVVLLVSMALDGGSVAACTAGDRDGSGSIEVDEIVAAIGSALAGCAPGSAGGD